MKKSEIRAMFEKYKPHLPAAIVDDIQIDELTREQAIALLLRTELVRQDQHRNFLEAERQNLALTASCPGRRNQQGRPMVDSTKALYWLVPIAFAAGALAGWLIGYDFVQSGMKAGREAVKAPAPPSEYAVFPPSHGWQQIEMDRIIDGDTVDFFFLAPARGRLLGINAPEMTGTTRPDGEKAKAGLSEKLRPGGKYRVRLAGRDNFGRVLVEIFDSDNHSVNQLMLDRKLAVPYDP